MYLQRIEKISKLILSEIKLNEHNGNIKCSFNNYHNKRMYKIAKKFFRKLIGFLLKTILKNQTGADLGTKQKKVGQAMTIQRKMKTHKKVKKFRMNKLNKH